MKKLITMTLSAFSDGTNELVEDSTQTLGNEWHEVLKGMIMLRDELDRQIKEGYKCPYAPRNIKRNGVPEFNK